MNEKTDSHSRTYLNEVAKRDEKNDYDYNTTKDNSEHTIANKIDEYENDLSILKSPNGKFDKNVNLNTLFSKEKPDLLRDTD